MMPPATGSTHRSAVWLAETVRLREEHWGPLEDADAVRQARQLAPDFTLRILARAQALGRREGLQDLLVHWRQGAALTFVVLAVAALLAGVGVALGALGSGARPVNVLWALDALLGLHALTFVLWLASFALRPRAAGLGGIWLWATRKLARGPDAALIPQALLDLLARAGALRWLLGAVSHILWLAALCAALATLLIVLSTASYRFVWATTLLQPETFVTLTQALGWLPGQLGFALPDAALVRASDGAQVLPATAQVQWSIWLLGALVCYGIAPRLLAALYCLAMAARALRGLRLDTSLPGYAVLRDRLLPPAASTGIDRPADPLHAPRMIAAQVLPDLANRPVLAALELAPDQPWPPAGLPANVFDAGNLDTREQRSALLDALARSAASRLLIACDARQTPDRGTLALLTELSDKAAQTRVWLLQAGAAGAGQGRGSLWQARLLDAGLPEAAILRDADHPLRWLEAAHD
ncbi:membrane protein [Bordetella pertussis]|uniref:DUF2868 domain-containing protein n=1 Tax=Bordetella pertussis TaxID=520 RepID=UPI00097995FD|nr:DUF2868 domain-containing protein [Bordetella pertussis]AQC99270.1 membrane protein [Bordetella pertussis]AZX66976.1 DUF2868 domain-containing protein [Bordetella pertussis]